MSVTSVHHARHTSRVALSREKRPTKEAYKWVPYKRPSYVCDVCDIRLVLYHTRQTSRVALSREKRPTKEAYKWVPYKRPSYFCDVCAVSHKSFVWPQRTEASAIHRHCVCVCGWMVSWTQFVYTHIYRCIYICVCTYFTDVWPQRAEASAIHRHCVCVCRWMDSWT